MGKVEGTDSLNYKAGLDISEVQKSRDELNKIFKELGIASSGAFDAKPMSEYQAGLLKVKQESLEFAKAKAAIARADKEGASGLSAYQQAQLALQKSLADARVEVQRLVQINQQLRNELEQGKIAAQNNRTEVERLKIAEQELKNAFTQGKIGLQEYNKQVQANKVAQGELNQKLTEAAIKDKQAATALKEHTLEQKKLAQAAKEARAANVTLSGSYNAAQARLKELGARIKGVQDGFEKMTPAMRRKIKEYNELNDKLKAFDAQMGNHQRNVGNYQRALEGLRGMLTTFVGAQAILAGVRQVINTNAELSDSLSDVRRTAGLTAEEANNLADQLKKIDTRTSLKGLLDIAVIGGQLGIAKDQLAGFTSAVNQLAVSLSGELQGGAEGIAKSLGVLDNVFGVTQSNAGDVEKSFNQIGSAILGLGQSGLATGDYLADFGERVGGLAKQAGLSLPVILSYGAVLQENGVNAEVAGSAFKRLLAGLTTNREKFFAVAKIADANLTLKDFTNLINNDAKGALDLFFNGLAKGGSTTTEFNDILKSLRLQGAGVSQAIAALSNGQQSLNGHIQDATKDFDEATLSAEQYAIKNDNLAGSIDKLGNTFVKYTTSGAIGNFFKEIIDYIRISLDEFGKLVNSSSWKEFWSRISNNGGALWEIKTGFASNSKKTNDNQQFLYPAGVTQEGLEKKLAGKGEKFNKQYLYNLKKTMDEAGELVKKYEDGVREGKLKEDKVTIADYKTNYNKAKAYYEDVYKLQKKLGFNKTAAQNENGTPSSAVSTQTKAEIKAQESALKRQRALQSEIDALTRKGVASKLDADQQEIISVEEKYRKLREKAITYNAEQIKLDAERAKKGLRAQGLRVNTGGLVTAEAEEKQEIRYKAEAKVLAKSLDEQAKYYAEYEDLKTKIGEQKAKERYEGLIDTDRSYLEHLKRQEDEMMYGTAKGGGEEQEYNKLALKELQERRAKAEIAQQAADDDRYARAIQAAMTHAQALEEIDREYNANKAALGSGATQEQIDNLDRQRAEAIRNANETNAYLKSGYDELMQNYDAMTRQQVRDKLEVIKAGYREEYRLGNLTAEQLNTKIREIDGTLEQLDGNNSFNRVTAALKKYREQVKEFGKDSNAAKDAQREMYAVIADAASDVNTVLSEVAGSMEQLGIGGDGLQNVIKNVQGVADGIGGIAKGIATGNPVDVVTGSIKLLTSAISLFNTKDKKLQKQIDGYKEQLDSLGRAYSQLDRAVNNSVGESFYTDSQRQIDNLLQQQRLLTDMRDAEARKKKSDKGKIDEYNAQLAEIPNKIEDIKKAIAENLIQTNFKELSQNLADALASAFASGEDSAKAFDDVFRGVISNAIKNSLKLKILDPIIKKFTDDLTKYAQGNDNSVLGFDFGSYKEELKKAADLFNEGLKGSAEYFKNVGLDSSDIESGSALSKSITSITSDQANALEGITRGAYEQTKIVAVNTSLLTPINKSLGEMYLQGVSNLAYQQRIANGVENTVQRLDMAVSELKAINSNTKASGKDILRDGGWA